MTDIHTVPEWVNDAIIYEIFPDRFHNGDSSNDPPGTVSWDSEPTRTNFFGGDLQGIIDCVDYLKDLGATCLYLTPIFEAPTNHRYDAKNYFRVDPALGTSDTLKQLAAILHSNGMKILLDGVFGHVSDEFPPFQHVIEHGAESPYADWFLIDEFPVRKHPHLTYRACGGLSSMPRLNPENPEIQELMCEVGQYWIRTAGIDGWRLDMAWEVPRQAWRKFRESVRAVTDDAFLLGEFWGDASPWLSGDQLDSSMNYRWRDIVMRFFVTQCIDARTFAREIIALRNLYGGHAKVMVNLLGSHDTSRLMTVCRQDSAKAVQAMAFLMTDVGVPLIYYGDEIGLTGENDPGCRGSMPWDESQWNHEVYEACRDLTGFRRRHPALRRGDFQIASESGRVLVFLRRCQDDVVLAAFNAGFQGEKVVTKLPPELRSSHTEAWSSRSDIELRLSDDGCLHIQLPPQGVVVVGRLL